MSYNLIELYGDIWEDFIQSWSPSFFSLIPFSSQIASNHVLQGEESKITDITRGKGQHYSKNCMESFFFHEEENLYAWNPYISLSWRKKTGVIFDWINADVSGDIRGRKWWEMKPFEFDQIISARRRVPVIEIQSRSVNGRNYRVLQPCLNCGRSVLSLDLVSYFYQKDGSQFLGLNEGELWILRLCPERLLIRRNRHTVPFRLSRRLD